MRSRVGSLRLGGWSLGLALLATPGCLVSFGDYELESASGGAGGTATGPITLIDDFEDGDGRINAVDGRNGSWFVRNDGTGRQEPAPGAPFLPLQVAGKNGPVTYAARVSGDSFATGAAVGLNFKSQPGGTYDASAFRGVSIGIRSVRGDNRVWLSLPTEVSDPEGDCTLPCNNLGAWLTLNSDWRQYTLLFAEAKTRDGGSAGALDPTQLKGILLEFKERVEFEVYLDDVTFVQ